MCPMHVEGSNHYAGIARDYGDMSNDCHAIVAALIPFATGPNPVIIELYYAPTNTWLKNGRQLSRSAIGDHDDHVHAAIDPNRILIPLTFPPAPPIVVQSSTVAVLVAA